MDNSIQSSICKGLRACGVTKQLSHDITNLISRWVDKSGIEWTVKRLGLYRQWYESILAGHPEPPVWFKKTRDGFPLGPMNRVFKIRNTARVFAVLSADTVFKSREILPGQRQKFLEALSVNPVDSATEVAEMIPPGKRKKIPTLSVTPPPFEAISGLSIPISSNDGKIFVDSPEKRILAYVHSWANVPLATLRFLRRERHLEQVPPALLEQGGKDGLFSTLPTQERESGFIGLIQEPRLKARWIANPNRISQWYMRPLGQHWYHLLKNVSTDCTYDQESGVRWAQDQLKRGISLSGADLTSATDLLDMRGCLELVSRKYLGRSLKDKSWAVDPVLKSYKSHLDHFSEISRGEWVYPEGGTVKWNRGQPLGTYPSFALLGLTNNALGELSCQRAGIPLDSFRVIGDDIIMDSRALSHYCELVEGMGGLINHSKTLTSDKAAEFAGRIITPKRSFPKVVKWRDMSDNSFMEILSNLGDQAKSLLRPRQRKQYDIFKYIPGIAVDGPYAKNSFGEKLEHRFSWFLNTSLADERPVPDKEKLSPERFAQKIFYTLSEKGSVYPMFDLGVPYSLKSDFQSDLESAVLKQGDPRLSNGLTALEVLESISTPEDFELFCDFKARYEERQRPKTKSRSVENDFER